MKKAIIITLIQIIAISCCLANPLNTRKVTYKVDTLPTNQLISYLQQLNVKSYYGKPVDSFLLAMPANLYNLKIYPDAYSKGGFCRAYSLVADFVADRGTGPGVTIYVNEFNYMNSISPSCSWDISLFRKEKVFKIDIWKNQNTCINGGCFTGITPIVVN